MNEATMKMLIIAAAIFFTVGLVVYLLRGKIKGIKVKGYGVSANVSTHKQDRLIVKRVEQNAAEGGNSAVIRSTNATVDGFKQTAHKDNVLDIGNP